MRKLFLLPAFLLFAGIAFTQSNPLQALVDSFRVAGNFPGLSVGIVTKENKLLEFSSGFNDKEKGIALKPTDKFLQGSVGKTYASAVALLLIKKGKLALDEKVSYYLGHHSWYSRVPNAANITVRMLMNHTSGVMRYELEKNNSPKILLQIRAKHGTHKTCSNTFLMKNHPFPRVKDGNIQ